MSKCDHYWEHDSYEVETPGFRPYTDVFLRCSECGETRDIGDGDCDEPDPDDQPDYMLETYGTDAYFRVERD